MKYLKGSPGVNMNTSLPVRGAWVEIEAEIEYCQNDVVAPRAGSVG